LYPKPKPIKQKGKPKRRGPSERQYLENQLDSLVSRYVIMRDRGCVTPSRGCYGDLTCSHFYARGKKRVRYDLINCNCQCSKHNNRHNRFQSYYADYMLCHYGHEQFAEMTRLANFEKWEWSVPELRQMVLNMSVMLSELSSRSLPALVEEVGQEK
jgi:Bacteriophage Lambda NinG protein